MFNSPKLIGVTGGIGAGKSTICKIFETLGHKVYDADSRARWLMENDDNVIQEVKGLFGGEGYREDGKLNRKLIAERVFKDHHLLAQLNEKVHPAVGIDLKNWITLHQNEKILFDEASLLFETGSYMKMDKNILVTSPEQIRIERVVKRDPHRTKESVKEILNQQMCDMEKIPLSDIVINNDGSASVIEQVIRVYRSLV